MEKVQGGLKFCEGPTWTPEGLLFTDISGSAIVRADGVHFKKPSQRANGLAWDPRGRLIACEHVRRRLTAYYPDGREETLATHYNGKRLNGPNDLVIRKDGTILFTDPKYGLGMKEKGEVGFSGVYALDKNGAVRALYTPMTAPNGIAIAPDEKTLYVADSEDGHIMAFDISEDSTLSRPRMLTTCIRPDGIKVDRDGRVWAACRDGVCVYDGTTGARVQRIRMREQPANLAFAPDGTTLYITALTSLYKTTVSWSK